jgi:curved DNA-binding protein CbpA
MISILKQMGNGQSQIHPTYLGIYTKLIQIQNVHKRAETIQTLLSAPEYVNVAKQLGVYSSLVQYIANVQNGRQPGLLPGERSAPSTASAPSFQAPQIQQRNMLVNYQAAPSDPYEQLAQTANNDRALNYFQVCLQVLELEEEVALTEEALKVAYKKAALKAHPDKKGGSEKAFELVTRSYAYLTEILRRVRGGRDQLKKVDSPTALKDTRFKESDDFQHVKPVKFNPDKLDMNAFNQMFEKTRMPDPDDEGYGDWLRTAEDAKSSPTFGGKFNRDVFHKMFEDETAKKGRQGASSSALSIAAPQSLMLAPSMGVELGRDRPDSYTAAANASLKYTDLKAAYTTESTFSGQVSDVRVDPRDYETYANTRKRAPDPLRDEEREAIAHAEKAMEDREKQRAYRAANEGIAANDYFERMKQLVITDGVPIGKTKRK